MPEQPQLIYLEPDDEITSVVRRLRAAEGGSVVIVAPGRSRATSSSVALRLLAQVAAEEARTLSLVADAPTRAVAGEAGIAAFASVAEATSGIAAPDHAATPRAPIHVVRGLPEGAASALASAETMAVRLPPKPATGSGQTKRRRLPRPRWPWLAGLLVLALIAGAALLPGATVSITPTTRAVSKSYQVHLPVAAHQTGDLHATGPGAATGTRLEEIPATGTVTFFNRSTFSVEIPQGSRVSAGGAIVFATTERIVVPGGAFFGDPGQKSVGVVAVLGGPSGNVAAGAIDTIESSSIRSNRRVTNSEATAGGLETPHPVIQQSDVDAVIAAIQAGLASQLADALAAQADRLYAAPSADEVPQITVPPDLVGTEDQTSFELSGTLAFDRPYVMKVDVEAAARAALDGDPSAAPAGTTVLGDSIVVDPGAATLNGQEMTVAVTVRAAAAAAINEAAVRDLVAGKTVAEAKDALADQGKVTIDLWPGWLDRLPRIPLRITVATVAPANGASPSP